MDNSEIKSILPSCVKTYKTEGRLPSLFAPRNYMKLYNYQEVTYDHF